MPIHPTIIKACVVALILAAGALVLGPRKAQPRPGGPGRFLIRDRDGSVVATLYVEGAAVKGVSGMRPDGTPDWTVVAPSGGESRWVRVMPEGWRWEED